MANSPKDFKHPQLWVCPFLRLVDLTSQIVPQAHWHLYIIASELLLSVSSNTNNFPKVCPIKDFDCDCPNSIICFLFKQPQLQGFFYLC